MPQKMMYPQKKIKVANQDWILLIVPRGNPKLMKSWGVTHFAEREIYIADYLEEKIFKHTLVHELLHAYFYELGFHTELLEKLKKNQNERLVDTLAKELMPKLRSNVFTIKDFKVKKSSR